MRSPALIGLDLGTASAKGAAFDLAGPGVAVEKTWRGPLARHEPDHGRGLEYGRLLAPRQELYASLPARHARRRPAPTPDGGRR